MGRAWLGLALLLAGCERNTGDPAPFLDEDGDGFTGTSDCDDSDPEVNPDATEIPWDGIDQDCDPSTPDDDLDSDGFGVTEDCDEADPEVGADAADRCHAIGAADVVLQASERGTELGATLVFLTDGSLAAGAPGLDGDRGGVIILAEDDLSNESVIGLESATGSLVGARALDRVGDTGGLVAMDDGGLLVGAPTWDPGGFGNAGVAFLLRSSDLEGTAPIADRAWLQLQGRATGDRFGERVGQGDLDGDGLTDLLITTSGNDTAYANAGALAVFLGSTLEPGTRSVEDADTLLTGSFNERLGQGPPRLVGDVDGDGTGDLLLASSTSSAAGLTSNGAVFLISGTAVQSGDAAAAAWSILAGAGEGDLFGAEAAGPGDLDGDGRADLAVAALRGDAGETNEGTVHLWFGDADLAGTLTPVSADVTWRGGTGLARAGDGLHAIQGDLIFGAPYGSGSSRAFVLAASDALAWTGGAPDPDAHTWVTAALSAPPIDTLTMSATGTLAAGLPTATVGTRTEAGEVHLFRP